jgi:LPXTG-motif cell wall-anchored protein
VPDASQPHGVRIEGDGNGVEQGNEPKQREPVIRGDIEITKYVKDHKDDSAIETGTHTPESGIIFDFYASRDFTGTTPNPGKVPAFSLTTDAAGFASTKGMYLIQNQDGTYTLQPRPATASGALPADSYLCVQQTSWTGWEKCDPFIYTVGNNGVTIPAVRYDPVIPAAIRIVKLDVETGREVPYPASWQIYSEQTRSFVKMQVGTTTTDIFSSDASGQLLLPEQLPYGSYQLREHTAPWGYILNKQVVKFSVLDRHDFDAPLVISFLDAPAKGTISIHKVAAPTKTDLKGATYAIIAAVDIYTPDGTLRHAKDTTVASITTGGAGRATSGPLYLGSYIVKETTAPDGYQLDKTEYPVVLVYAGQTVELVREQLELVDKEVGVEAFKYDLDTRQPVPDTEFKLWRENLPVSGSWVLVGTQVSGADGKVVFKPVVRGSYKLVESRPNPLYASCEASGQPGTQYFTIDEDSTTVVLKYYNKKLIRGDIEIKKYIAEHKPDSAEPSGIVSPEAFVTFDFYASRDFVGLMPKRGKAPAFSLTTDIAGYASTITADIYLTQNSDGTYTITKRPAVTDGGLPADTYLCVQRDGYPEYDKAAPFVLAIDSLGIIRSKTIYDQPVSAFIRVVKLDSQTGREVFYPASWQIYSKQTKSYVKMKLGASMTDTFTSDAKGKLVLPEPLPYGDYLLHEAAAPHRDGRGYLANTTDLPFSVTQSTSASTPLVVIMKDDPAKGQITLEKRDAVCDEPVEGAVYTIFANEDIYTLDGTLHWADGDEVASITTDADGKAASGPLHLGKYTVKETSRPDGYHMDLDTHAVSLEYADQTTALVLVRLELTDEPQKVTGEKKDKDTDAPVPNTEFTLYKESALGAKDWVEVGVLVTDQDGKVTFSPVIAGSYKLVETKPNPNYASCEESGEMGTHYFVIDENSTDEVQVFYNKKIQLACETYKDTINITSAAFKTFDEDHVQINNIGTETYEYLLGFRSLANVRADEYTVVDEMENAQFGQVALVSLTTPVPYGDSDGRFNLWYRTNMTDPGTLYSDVNALVDNPANPLNPHNEPMRSSLGWQLWAQGLPTTSPTTLAVSALGLQDGEYITGVRYEYGSVEVGFATDDGAIGFTQVDKAGLYWTPPAAASEGEARSVPNGGEREDVGTDEGVETQATGLAPASSPVVSQPARYEVAAQHAILPPEDIRSSVNVFIARNLTLTDTDQDAVVTTVVEPFMVTPAEEVPYPSSRDSQIPNKLPQTGDQLTLLLLSLAAVLAGMGIVVLVVKKVRDRKRRAGVAGEVARGAADGEVAGEVASGVTGGAKSDAMDEVADEMDPGQ